MSEQYTGPDTHPMRHRKEDDTASNILRVVDWKWMLGVIVGGGLWAISQWVQYNTLLVKFADQSELIVKLSTRLETVSIQLSTIQTDKLKQDFELSRLKDKQDQVEVRINSLLSGRR